ncbi:MAG: HAD-IA family hydrolase [Sedimenticolaceae bacterium]|nr:HAD-IA family hydrolase [Sedimenticolaceae bacterium]
MYQLLVFDWDGTLMDSEAKIVACLQAAAAEMRLAIPAEKDARQVIGLGLVEALKMLFPEDDETTRKGLAEAYRDHFLVRNKARSRLFPDVTETLESLADDYLLAVATGKSRRGLEKELDDSGLRPLFQATRCADEAFSKPHPQMLEDILDKLGMRPSETLVIGDTEYDMRMAVNAGSQGLGVSYGVHEPQRLIDSGALATLDAFSEMPVWLSSR